MESLYVFHQSQTFNPLDNDIWNVFENKTSHPNNGPLKYSIEEERNKMSEEFILETYKSFRKRVDTIIEKTDGHIEEIYCFVRILFCLLFF